MKRIKYIITLSLALLATNFYGMYLPANPAVEVYFVPEQKNEIMNTLFSLLDGARRQVLVAMYWITNDLIVNKLISLKQREIDVQIIFDESSDGSDQLITKLSANNIYPIVFISESPLALGKMHNKYLVIDDEAVFTGSSNFTKTAFEPNSDFFNFENVLVLRSNDVIQKYLNNFANIEQKAFDLFINTIVGYDLPDTLSQLALTLYQNKPQFQSLVQSYFEGSDFNQEEKNRLQDFFGLVAKKRRVDPPTEKQVYFLKIRDKYDEGMSKQEATRLIGEIKQQESQQQKARPNYNY